MTDQLTICKTINKQEMNEEQINRIVTALLHDPSVRQSVQLRRMMIVNDTNAIHTLAESIRQTPRHTYANLTDDILSQIIDEIREQYGTIDGITLDDWANEDVVNRLVELHGYVRRRLGRMLDKQERNIGWSVAGKIINAVFGNVPVITKGVRKALKESHLLQYQYTNSIRTLLLSIREWWNMYRDDIVAIVGELSVNAAFDLGQGLTPQETAILLIPLLLTQIFRVIYKGLGRNNNNNVEQEN